MPVIILAILTAIFVLVNFLFFLGKGRIFSNKNFWLLIQIWTVIIVPIFFLFWMDLSNENDCCSDSAIFSPDHRVGIYILMVTSMAAYITSIFRTNVFPPISELILNTLLVLGFIINLLLCKHLTTNGEGPLWWLVGNLPILILYLLALIENQNILTQHIKENELTTNNALGKFSLSILKLDPILKYPALTFLLLPIILLLSLFLMLFGQKPDSVIRAFTDTYKHGFSQLDYVCENVECGGHFLCSVGANGHKSVVKPIRYGERLGSKIICNRQLLISNAFEELVQEKMPKLHKLIRKHYNKVGDSIHKYYYIFNKKIISDIVYLLMKPLEIIFLITLYTFDVKPENRIAKQYLNTIDKEKINSLQNKI